LGADTLKRFGPALPFLMKILAVELPLSLQVHPSRDRAAMRFAEEQNAGLGNDDPSRLYQDANHKPELLCALTTFSALCGFAPITESVALFDGLGGECANALSARLRAIGASHGTLQSLVEAVLRRTYEVGPVISRCREVLENSNPIEPDLFQKLHWCVALADLYPGDPAAVVSLLMNLVTIHNGESIGLPAGVLHAYLRGAGIEVMAASDNVLRAGLTSKVVAVEELLQVVDFQPSQHLVVPASILERLHTYESPSDEFNLSVIRPGSEMLQHAVTGPELVVCVSAAVSLRSAFTHVVLRPGEAAFVMACASEVSITGAGELFLATTGTC
jgi:mannose-6-phosphate isomerase